MAPGFGFIQATVLERQRFAPDPRRQRVHVFRLVQLDHRLHGLVEQANQVAEGIAEEARHAQGDVHPWATELLQGHDFETLDTLAAWLPHRAHAKQRQGLGNIVATGAHGRRAPHRKAELAQVVALVLQVTLQQAIRRLHTQAPSGRRRQMTHVDGEEVAPRGQHVQAPTARRTARPGGHETPLQSRQQAAHLGVPTRVQQWRDMLGQAVEDQRHLGAKGFAALTRQALLDQPQRQQLQTLAGIANGAPQAVIHSL